jgi:hypothetical protein
MKHIYVDFSRGESLRRIEIGYESEADITALHLVEGETAILEDISLGVQGIVHQEQRNGEPYWYAIPDWATRQDYDDRPYQAAS